MVSVAIGVEKLTRFRADAGGCASIDVMTFGKSKRVALAKFELHARAMGRGRGGKGGKGGRGGGSKLQRCPDTLSGHSGARRVQDKQQLALTDLRIKSETTRSGTISG